MNGFCATHYFCYVVYMKVCQLNFEIEKPIEYSFGAICILYVRLEFVFNTATFS